MLIGGVGIGSGIGGIISVIAESPPPVSVELIECVESGDFTYRWMFSHPVTVLGNALQLEILTDDLYTFQPISTTQANDYAVDCVYQPAVFAGYQILSAPVNLDFGAYSLLIPQSGSFK